MNRFLIFGGQCFYARGGFKDLIGQAEDLEDARARAVAIVVETEGGGYGVEWWHIVDTQTGEIVAQSDETALGALPRDAEAHNLMFMGGYLVPEAVDLEDSDG